MIFFKNQDKKQGKTQKTGNLGESLACKFLMKHGYKIIERNYWKPFGEIDIIVKRQDIVHFIEVKTVSYETNVSRETLLLKAAENIHRKKFDRLRRTITAYLSENFVSHETNWQLDAILVALDGNKKEAHIDFLENISKINH